MSQPSTVAILIYTESQIGSDVNESLAAINRVRNAAGLGNYLGATDDTSMLNEVLRQRRYSLFGEGHRWVDLRRTGKIGEIPIDRVGDVADTEFPRPGMDTLRAISAK
ncbi:MAG: RagB/SusD family nutrient uptake outer membrane protein [Myxococcales bacterium]|nr:RagB/SusD family nutrient uptake outer membrane protein [Myxococcales bacterium]MDH3482949.1 RagB/SusD family nutrient uptake outer membrane protein [Myxococcales bacterium]